MLTTAKNRIHFATLGRITAFWSYRLGPSVLVCAAVNAVTVAMLSGEGFSWSRRGQPSSDVVQVHKSFLPETLILLLL